MDDITQYLMFMPTRARDTPAATAEQGPERGDALPVHGDRRAPEKLRRLLADPDLLAALLRLARG